MNFKYQVAKGIGGGLKHKFHWVKYDRDGPEEGSAQEERVIDVMFDGHRSAKVALVGNKDNLRYIIATENMKPGDIIKTSRAIPRNPGKRSELKMCLRSVVNILPYFQFEQMKETHIHWVHCQLAQKSIVLNKRPDFHFTKSERLVHLERFL